jgi:hypothetical protein
MEGLVLEVLLGPNRVKVLKKTKFSSILGVANYGLER